MWECLGLHLQSQYPSMTFTTKIQDNHFFFFVVIQLKNRTKSEQWTGTCALVLLLLFLASVKPGSKRGTDRRTWIRVAGITWNCGRKEKLCSIFELLNCTVIGCHSEAFLSLSYVWADSQVRVGGRCLRSVCWKPLMKNHKQLWSLKLLYTAECEEGKAVPESYCLNFCTLKVFVLVLLLFLYLVAGVCCFLNRFLEAATPQCCDPGHPCGGTEQSQNTTKSSRVCLMLLQDVRFSTDKAGLFVI